jgi:hypothetical protein
MGRLIQARKSRAADCNCLAYNAIQTVPKEHAGVPATKLLLAMQYWEGDRAQAEAALRLMADLQPGFSKDAGVVICCRFDAVINSDLVGYVSKKFPVFTHRSTRQGVGWPFGCNELWFDLMLWIDGQRTVGTLREYKAVFTMESDDAPIVYDWIAQLSAEFDAKRPAQVVGHLLSYDKARPTETEHINGNALFALDLPLLALLRRKQAAPPDFGWDAYMAPHFRKIGWAHTNKIRSLYRLDTATDAILDYWRDRGCAVIHGVKDLSALELTRKRFLAPAG